MQHSAIQLPCNCLVQQGLLIRNTLDVMHCEKNITESLMKFLFGKKDTLKVRMDLKKTNIRPYLWPILEKKQGTLTLSQVPYVLTKKDKEVFVDIVRQLKTHTHYVGQLRKTVHIDGSLKWLKSHDYHVLMEQVLLLCVRTIMRNEVRICIIRLSRILKRLCAKTINPSKMSDLRENMAITLCMIDIKLSRYFAFSLHIEHVFRISTTRRPDIIFAFPLHVEHVFFADDSNNNRWKVVLQKEARGARVISTRYSILDIRCLILGNMEDHCELKSTSLENDTTPTDPILDEM